MSNQTDINFEIMLERRFNQMLKDNERENTRRFNFKFKLNNNVILFKLTSICGKLADPYTGPYKIVKIHKNGTVTIDCRTYTERVNIRWVKPFMRKEQDITV